MSPIQNPMTPAPLSPDIYSESIEQQFAIIHDFLLTRVGAALLANDSWVRRQLATPSELARHVASRAYQSKPFFITAPITQGSSRAVKACPSTPSPPSASRAR